MKFMVVWHHAAEQELARIWLSAADRDAVKQAAMNIDARLCRSPQDAGESRVNDRRILIETPLAVTFRVFEADRRVFVSNVREFQPKVR